MVGDVWKWMGGWMDGDVWKWMDGDVWTLLTHPNGIADDPRMLRFRDDVSIVQQVPKLLPIRHHNEDPVGTFPGSLPQGEQLPPAPGGMEGMVISG